MKPDQSIDVQLVDESGKPAAIYNVMINLSFFTKGNYRYGFSVGRTNLEGKLVVSYTDVEAIRQSNASYDLMDYNTRLEECDSRVEIVIDSENELRQRYDSVLRSYGRAPTWASHWPSNAAVLAQKKLVELAGPMTRVEIPAETENPRGHLSTPSGKS